MKRLFAGFLCCTFLFFTGCNGSKPQEQTSSSQPVESGQTSSIAKPVTYQNPLTGEMTLDKSAVGKRPISIMINNIKIALPQKGLAQADLCYEVLAEGGITRIMALFADYTKLPVIGSIRSTRQYFLDLAAPHKTIFVHFGASPQAYSTIKARSMDNIDGMVYSRTAFIQDKDRAKKKGKEHSYFTSAEYIQKAIDKKKIKLDGSISPAFEFAKEGKEVIPSQTPADKITVPYSGYTVATFSYDAAKKKYLKGQFKTEHMDAGINQQIMVDNVFVIFADINIIDGDKSNRIEVNLSSGNGYYATRGKIVPIKWKKGNYTDPLKYTTVDGQPLEVNIGKSWVSVVSTAMLSEFSYEAVLSTSSTAS